MMCTPTVQLKKLPLFSICHTDMQSDFWGSVTQNSKSAGRNLGDHSGGTCCASYVAGILSLGGRSMKERNPKNNVSIKHIQKHMILRAFESNI